MTYRTWADLPKFLQGYIREIAEDSSPTWIATPVPALGDRSFLDFLNQEGLSPAVGYLNKVGSLVGIPHALVVPAEWGSVRQAAR